MTSRPITGANRARAVDGSYESAHARWRSRFGGRHAPDLNTPMPVLRDAIVLQAAQARQLALEAMSPLRRGV